MKLPHRTLKVVTAVVALSLSFTPAASSAPISEEGANPSGAVSVTATVSGDSELCDGFAVLSLSSNTLEASLERIVTGSVPDPWERLTLSSDEDVIQDYQDYAVTTESGTLPVFFLDSDGTTLRMNEQARNVLELASVVQDFDAADTNEDGKLDAADVSPLSYDQAFFSSPVFTVDFEANNCPTSEEYGILVVSREPVEVQGQQSGDAGEQWVQVELSRERLVQLRAGSLENGFVADSYLLTSDPFLTQDPPFFGPGPDFYYQTGLMELLFPSGPRRMAAFASQSVLVGSSSEQRLADHLVAIDTQRQVEMRAVIRTIGQPENTDQLRTSYLFELSRQGEGNDLYDIFYEVFGGYVG